MSSRRRAVVGVAVCVIVGCSGKSSSADCGAIEDEIRAAAIKRGYDGDGDGVPDAKGVCGSTNAAVQKDFASACERLRACNAGE